METIADRIRAWARKNVQNSGVMTRNTDAYNHMTAAVEELLAEHWTGHKADHAPRTHQAQSKQPAATDPSS